MINVAFLTLLERKVLRFSQVRVGPFKVGVWGVLQPFADAIKLLRKTREKPFTANKLIYSIAPVLMFFLVMLIVVIVSVFNFGNT